MEHANRIDIRPRHPYVGDAVIRVNSQSGKGGIAYLLETEYGIELPRRLQIDCARRVQEHTDDTGLEIDAPQLLELFERSYLNPSVAVAVGLLDLKTDTSRTQLSVRIDGSEYGGCYDGVGPIEALIEFLGTHGVAVDVVALHQTSLTAGNGGMTLTLIEFRSAAGTHWSAGRARSVLTASVNARLAAARSSLPAAMTH